MLLVWLISLAVMGLATPSAFSASIDHFGLYTFRNLGIGDLAFAGGQITRGRELVFTLPAGTREGPGHWYVLHLHAQVEIDANSPPGKAYLSAVSRSYGSANVAFTVGGRREPIEWSTLGIISGTTRHRSSSRSIEIRFANYMPFDSLSGGRNVMHFAVQQYGARVRSVRIYSDSAIEYTTLGPAQLVARATVNRPRVKVGQTVVATLELTNQGGRAGRSVRISTTQAGDSLRLRGTSTRQIRPLRSGEKVFESFAYTATKPGPARVFFVINSTANTSASQVDVTVTGAGTATGTAATTGSEAPQRTRSSDSSLAIILAGAFGGLAVVGIAVFVQLRRQRRSG